MISSMPIESVTTGALAKHGAIAFFGAMVHALNAYRNGQTKGPLDILTLTIISSFSGVMFFLVGVHFMGEGNYLTVALTGAGAFWGVEGTAVLLNAMKRGLIANLMKK